VPSPAAARTGDGRHDDRSGNDDDGLAIRTASAIGTAVEARTAATRHFDDQIGGSLIGRERHGLHGNSRKSQYENKSDEPVHALLPVFCATRSWSSVTSQSEFEGCLDRAV
jgi:hypothetical protein